MFTFCPSCGKTTIKFDGKNCLVCSNCGLVYYHNTAAAAGLFVKTPAGILLLERAREPGKGKLDVPGGFIDPGESVIDGLRRECREELNWDCGSELEFLASFPNSYPYKGILYNTCDSFFIADAPSLRAEDLTLEKSEVSACHFIKLSSINIDDIAFISARQACETLKARA